MSKVLMESLKMDLPALADMIRSKGRKGDSILAHISPKEAALLKRRGGSGTINPHTGLPEFAEDGGFDVGSYFTGADQQAVQQPLTPATTESGAPVTSFQEPSAAYNYAPATQEQIGQQFTTGYQAPDISQVPGYGAALKPGAAQIPAATTAAALQGDVGQVPLSSLSATQAPVSPVTPEDKSTLEKLGLTPKDLTRLGLGAALTGGLTAANISRTRQAQQQAGQAQAQQQALATPFQQQGQQLITQAQAGQLSPQSQAAYNAARAQMNQQIANTGGVGVQQASTQLATIYQNLLSNQYQLGNQILNIGDQYALGAIKTGLQADQAVNQANQNFYAALAQMAAPFIMGQQPVYQPTTRAV